MTEEIVRIIPKKSVPVEERDKRDPTIHYRGTPMSMYAACTVACGIKDPTTGKCRTADSGNTSVKASSDPDYVDCPKCWEYINKFVLGMNK